MPRQGHTRSGRRRTNETSVQADGDSGSYCPVSAGAAGVVVVDRVGAADDREPDPFGSERMDCLRGKAACTLRVGGDARCRIAGWARWPGEVAMNEATGAAVEHLDAESTTAWRCRPGVGFTVRTRAPSVDTGTLKVSPRSTSGHPWPQDHRWRRLSRRDGGCRPAILPSGGRFAPPPRATEGECPTFLLYSGSLGEPVTVRYASGTGRDPCLSPGRVRHSHLGCPSFQRGIRDGLQPNIMAWSSCIRL